MNFNTNTDISVATQIFLEEFRKPGYVFAPAHVHRIRCEPDQIAAQLEAALVNYFVPADTEYKFSINGRKWFFESSICATAGKIEAEEDSQGNYYVVDPDMFLCAIETVPMLSDFEDSGYEPVYKKDPVDRDGEKTYNVRFVSGFIDGDGDLKWSTKNLSTADMKDIRYELYPKINVPAMMDQYVKSKSNVLVLASDPGTGKTSLMRRAIADLAIRKEQDVTAVYIKDPAILRRDDFYGKLTDAAPDFVLLDDFDTGLESRRLSDDNEIIEKLLSYSNGVFKNKTKIVITTNRKLNNLDDALGRPGRCFNILAIPPLDYHEARMVWLNVYHQPDHGFSKIFGSDTSITITQARLDEEASSYGEFEGQSYLYDESISIRDDIIKESARISAILDGDDLEAITAIREEYAAKKC